MKVEMNLEKGSVKTGMLSSTPCVNLKLTVKMTEVERAAVQRLGIAQHRLFTYMPMDAKQREFNKTTGYPGLDGGSPCNVDQVSGDQPKTHTFAYKSLIDAQDAVEQIRKSMVLLKETLGRVDAPTSYSFEL